LPCLGFWETTSPFVTVDDAPVVTLPSQQNA
jgi:hypothetical protein